MEEDVKRANQIIWEKMDQMPTWVNVAIAIGGVLGTLVTAVATIFLWRVTKLLADETTLMAQATSRPHVVATIDSNPWALRHFDLNIDNTGNATAYDIEVVFDPPLEASKLAGKQHIVPFEKISVLKPGQGVSSYLSEYAPLEGKVYSVSISWRRDSRSSVRETNSYVLNMTDKAGVSRLGDDPRVEIANHIKKLEETSRVIADSVSKTLQINSVRES